MTSLRTVLAAGGAALALTFASGANAGIVNGGFESGDFTGWTQDLSSGGFQGVVGQHTSNYGATYNPIGGSSFALFGAGQQNNLSNISQAFSLHEGYSVSGWAFFDAQDYIPYNDIAKVEIRDSSGALVATPYYASVSSVGDWGDGAWTYWSYIAEETDVFTITMGVANINDSGYNSYAGFDEIAAADPIPEPATLTLFGLGLAGLGFARRRRA